MNENTKFYLQQNFRHVRIGPPDMRRNAYHFVLGYINALRLTEVIGCEEASRLCELALNAITDELVE
ncbi:MAG: hypothetical protein KAI85_12945 [Halopseudomonas aestusnigri]|nr:hypothetical protein [Halopseudomonas aestusnigri]